MENLIIYLSLGLLALPLLVVLPQRLKAYWSLALTGLFAVTSSLVAIEALRHGTIDYTFQAVYLLGNISFRIDALSAVFLLFVNLTTLLAGIYGVGFRAENSPCCFGKLADACSFPIVSLSPACGSD